MFWVDLPAGLIGELAGGLGGLKVFDELMHVVWSVKHGECFGVVWLTMRGETRRTDAF